MQGDKAYDNLDWNWSGNAFTEKEKQNKTKNSGLFVSYCYLFVFGRRPICLSEIQATLILEIIPVSEYKAKNLIPANLCLD